MAGLPDPESSALATKPSPVTGRHSQTKARLPRQPWARADVDHALAIMGPCHTICAAMARHADVCVLPVGRSDRLADGQRSQVFVFTAWTQHRSCVGWPWGAAPWRLPMSLGLCPSKGGQN
eukprot:scaffold10203_cov143-Isochrysis_galbana.AAC.1